MRKIISSVFRVSDFETYIKGNFFSVEKFGMYLKALERNFPNKVEKDMRTKVLFFYGEGKACAHYSEKVLWSVRNTWVIEQVRMLDKGYFRCLVSDTCEGESKFTYFMGELKQRQQGPLVIITCRETFKKDLLLLPREIANLPFFENVTVEFIQERRDPKLKKGWEKAYLTEKYIGAYKVRDTLFMRELPKCLKPGDVIADIASGNGRLARKFLSEFRDIGLYILVEPEQKLVAKATENLKEFSKKTVFYASKFNELLCTNLMRQGTRPKIIISSGGVLNAQVVSKQQAIDNLKLMYALLDVEGVVLVTGLSPTWFNSQEAKEIGFEVEQTSLIEGGNYIQFYVLRKPRSAVKTITSKCLVTYLNP